MKFTDEELSLILGAHEDGVLVSYQDEDCQNPQKYCAVEVAKGCHAGDAWKFTSEEFVQAFDRAYKKSWTTTQLLRWLERQGAA